MQEEVDYSRFYYNKRGEEPFKQETVKSEVDAIGRYDEKEKKSRSNKGRKRGRKKIFFGLFVVPKIEMT